VNWKKTSSGLLSSRFCKTTHISQFKSTDEAAEAQIMIAVLGLK